MPTEGTGDRPGVVARAGDALLGWADAWARRVLASPLYLAGFVLLNAAAVVVGVEYYVLAMPDVPVGLWVFFLDSPVAAALLGACFLTVARVGETAPERLPANRFTALLSTVAFVWAVKYGLWVVVALNLGFEAYFPGLWSYWGIIATHLVFAAEAFIVARLGRATRGTLAAALALALVNDALDYGFGIHPPLRYDPSLALPAATVALSVASVGLARWAFDPLDG